ncbi:hypothetical protein ABN080_06515, partial [Proteus sp. fly-1089]|uniref:hypothetical protein n=1 Tax=unclassified Proteus (in: enterobacteria) TaxID=257482 RepID=UPI0032DBF009
FFLFSSPSCVASCLLIAGQWMRIIGSFLNVTSIIFKKLFDSALCKQTDDQWINNNHISIIKQTK